MNTIDNLSKFPEIGGSIALDARTKTDQSADQIVFTKAQLRALIRKESKKTAEKAVKKELRKNHKKKRKSVMGAKVVTLFKKMGDTLLKKIQKVIPSVIIGGITTGITKIFNALTGKMFHSRRCSIS